MESNIEKAGKYIEATKINQENLWKRRQIEWKTSFSLWTAIAIASGFIYMYANRPIPSPQKWIFLVVVLVVYIGIIYLQRRHLRAITMSNEKDLDFINYYLDKAAWELNPEDFKKVKAVEPSRPKWSIKKENETINDGEKNFYQEHKDKMRHYYTPIIITGLIELLSWCILALMCFEKTNRC